MAELTQKLHYKINNITDEIECYSTIGEATNPCLKVKVGGINAYAGLVKAGGTGDISSMTYKDSTGTYKVLRSVPQKDKMFNLMPFRNNENIMLDYELPTMGANIGDTFYLDNSNAPTIEGYDFVMAIPNNFVVTEDTTNNLVVKVYYIPQSVADRTRTSWFQAFTSATGNLSRQDFANTYSGLNFIYAFNGTTITNAPKLNTSNATSLSVMFIECSSLMSIYPYDTKKCKDLSYMFQRCSSLDFTTNNANTFDLTNAINVNYMFADCSQITADKPIHLKNVPSNLDLSGLGTEHYIVDNYI